MTFDELESLLEKINEDSGLDVEFLVNDEDFEEYIEQSSHKFVKQLKGKKS